MFYIQHSIFIEAGVSLPGFLSFHSSYVAGGATAIAGTRILCGGSSQTNGQEKGFSEGTCTLIAAYLKVVNTVVGCLSSECTLFNTILVLFHMLVHMIICLQ